MNGTEEADRFVFASRTANNCSPLRLKTIDLKSPIGSPRGFVQTSFPVSTSNTRKWGTLPASRSSPVYIATFVLSGEKNEAASRILSLLFSAIISGGLLGIRFQVVTLPPLVITLIVARS